MFGDKLFSLIERFSQQERRRFGRFLASPYHNDNEQALQLWKIIKSTTFESPPDKHFLWRNICPGRPMDEAHLRRLMSELFHWDCNFLPWSVGRK